MKAIELYDGIIFVDINELIMGNDDTIIGIFFHKNAPLTPQKVKRLSTTAQMVFRTLIEGNTN